MPRQTGEARAAPVDCRACRHVRSIDGERVKCGKHGPDATRTPWYPDAVGSCDEFEPSAVVSAAPLFMGAPR